MSKSSFFTCAMLVFCVFTKNAAGQQLHINHTRLIGGYAGDYLSDIAFDPRDKSIIFCGSSDSTGGDLPPYAPGHKYHEATFGKIDSSGNLLWIKRYGGSSDEFAITILTPLYHNGYLLAGYTSSNDGDVSGNNGGIDLWLLRLDDTGKLLWQRCYGGIYTEAALKCSQTSDGGFILLGATNSPTSGDIPYTYVNTQFLNDWFALKTDSLGNIEWLKIVGGTDDEWVGAAIFEVDNSFYIAGTSESKDHECSDLATKPYSIAYFLIKLDSAGNYLWNKAYGGSNGGVWLRDAVWDERDSSFVLVGRAGAAGGYDVPPSPGLQGCWILKLDRDGAIIWSRAVGEMVPAGIDWAHIKPAPLHNGYIIACEVRPLNAAVTPPGYFGRYDVHVFLIDSAGNTITDKQMGGPDYEHRPVAIATDKGFVVAGQTWSSQFNEGTITPKHGTNPDIFVSWLEYWPQSIAEDNTRGKEIRLHPNPAKDEIVVELPDTEQHGVLSVRNMEGKSVFTQRVQKQSCTISARVLPRGNYIVIWQGDKGTTYTQKLILK